MAAGCLAFLASAVFAAGCSPFGQIGSWPLLATELETEDLPGRAEMFGPLVDVQWQQSTVQWGLRPLFSVRQYRDVPLDRQAQFDVPFFAPPALLSSLARRTPPRTAPGEGRTALQVLALYPFYTHESCGPMSRTSLLLYSNVRYETSDGDWHRRWELFPLYFGGNSSRHGLYHALFPLGGMLKNKFGRDEIIFVLFPLFTYARSGERRSYHLPWPFVRWASGGGRDVWHVWPLIGRMRRQDNPPQWFFLWPFFWYSEEPEEGERDSSRTAFFPFWGRQQQGDVTVHNVLWPLFSHARNDRTGRTDYVTPFPILRLGWGPDYDRFQVWPLFGVLRDQHIRRQYVLWPLFRFEQRDQPRSRMRGRSLLVLYRSISREWENADGDIRSDYENLLWPLWYYKRDAFDNTYFGTLALRGVPDPQGWDRFYSFIWRIFEHESRTYGRRPDRRVWRSTRALWGAFRYDRDDDSSFLRMFPLFTSRRAGGRFRSFEVLAGMFGYVDRPGTRTYRVLFVPWTVSREDDE